MTIHHLWLSRPDHLRRGPRRKRSILINLDLSPGTVVVVERPGGRESMMRVTQSWPEASGYRVFLRRATTREKLAAAVMGA